MVVEKVFAVIAESTRRDILEALAQDSKAVGQLVDELGVSQPTVSKHLRVLREAGVVTIRAQGQKRFYGINTEPLALVSTWLDSLGAGIIESSGSPSAAAAGALTAAGVPALASDKEAAVKPAAAAAVSAPGAATLDARPVAETPTEANHAELPAVPVETAVSGTGSAPASVAAAASAPVAEAVSGAVAALAETGSTASPSVDSSSTDATSVAVAPGEPAAAIAPKPPSAAFVKQSAIAGVGSDGDGGVPRQLGRSVGRAAKKGADLLATFKRRKD